MKKPGNLRSLVAAVVTCGLGAFPAAGQWLMTWQGVDRPGPENLPFTVGWPTDAPGFEQHDPNGCYDPPGPDYAESANFDSGGFLSIMNVVDASCMGIGFVDGGPCNSGGLLQTRADPCGMRYQVGPRTVLNFWGAYDSKLVAYQGPDAGADFGTGLTAEVTFYVAQSPQFVWTPLIEIEGYPRFNNPLNQSGGGGGTLDQNNYTRILLRHFMPGRPDNEWHLAASADHTFDLGLVDDLIGRWVTVRLALGSFAGLGGKPQMVVWLNGLTMHGAGWDAVNQGDDNGTSAHGYCRFGFKETDGDVRIGTIAFTNQGVFTPNPIGEFRNIAEGCRYLRHLPAVLKTPVNPEICDNAIDDDGDALVDCDDPQCFQDGVCGNLLFNGSFEEPGDECTGTLFACPNPPCSNDNLPPGWTLNTGSNIVLNGSVWIPDPRATDGFVSGGTDNGGGTALTRVVQTVNVQPDTMVRLRGDVATGHEFGSVNHFIELLDGNASSSSIIASFVVTASDQNFQPFDISGVNSTGQVTVRWGYQRVSFGGIVATHVDNLYLTGVAPAPCSDPFADADGDGDVDQDDFGEWQRCYTGPGGGPIAVGCACFDVQGPSGPPDGDIDQADFALFEDCASGPTQPADPACDDGVVPGVLNVVEAVSRKLHGSTARNIDLLSIPAGGDRIVDSRADGVIQIVVSFDDNIQAADGSLDIGDEVSAIGGTVANIEIVCETLTIDLTGVTDESCLRVTLSGIARKLNAGDVMADRTLEVVALLGDVDSNGVVNQLDEDAVSARINQPVTDANARYDLDLDDDIDNVDRILANGADGNSAACP